MEIPLLHNYIDKPSSFGIVVDYVCRLVKNYPQYTLDYILYELPMLRGWALYSWSYANEPMHQFSGIRMVDSYASREADSLYEELIKEMKMKQKK